MRSVTSWPSFSAGSPGQRLPLADPFANSLGRLYGQYPALTYVDCADDIRVIFITADLTASRVGRLLGCVWPHRGSGQRKEVYGAGVNSTRPPRSCSLYPKNVAIMPHPWSRMLRLRPLFRGTFLPGSSAGTFCARRHVPHPELLQPVDVLDSFADQPAPLTMEPPVVLFGDTPHAHDAANLRLTTQTRHQRSEQSLDINSVRLGSARPPINLHTLRIDDIARARSRFEVSRPGSGARYAARYQC
jgi:hypothetical protein